MKYPYEKKLVVCSQKFVLWETVYFRFNTMTCILVQVQIVKKATISIFLLLH